MDYSYGFYSLVFMVCSYLIFISILNFFINKILFIGFFLLISLVCIFFITCTVFFWIALAALIGRIIFKYIDEHNQTSESFDNHETVNAIKP